MDTHNIIQYLAAAVAVIAVIAAFLAYNAGVARAKALVDKQTRDTAEKLEQELRAVEQAKREVKLSAKEDALKIIREESGTHFDPQVVKVFLEIVNQGPQ